MLEDSSFHSWRRGHMAQIVANVEPGVSVDAEDRPMRPGEKAVLKTSAVLTRKLRIEEHKAVDGGHLERLKTPLKSGCVVVCRKNADEHIGAAATVEQSYQDIFLPDLLWQVEPREEVDQAWFGALCTSELIRLKIAARATGSHASMRNVSQDAFLEIPVEIPPLPEQRRIAEISRSWDEAIDRTRALIDNSEREFGALAASLLTGHRRFGGSSVAWTRRFLGDVTREVGARNGRRYGRERVKAVNKIEGMIPMKDHVIGGDLSRYRIVPPRGLAYNPMRLNIGSIAMNEHGGEVLVSPDYVVFEAQPGQLDPDFLNHFRRTSRWQRFMEIAGSGSGSVRIYYDDLAQMPLDLPPIHEQRSIAAFLSLARREIDLRRTELAALEKQKRGLMQKLLTGEWRVPVGDGEVAQATESAAPAVAVGAV